MRVVASYPDRAALEVDVAQQLAKGGLLVRGEVPADVELFAAVELEVTAGDASVASLNSACSSRTRMFGIVQCVNWLWATRWSQPLDRPSPSRRMGGQADRWEI